MDDVMYAHIGQGTGVTKKRILKKTQQALRPSRILKPTHQEQQRAAPGAESDIYNGFVCAGVREDVLSTRRDQELSVLGRLLPAVQRFRLQPRRRSCMLDQQHHSR